jgi:hypothetical protein
MAKRGIKWAQAFGRNKAIASNYSKPDSKPLDMVMVGDSMMEFWYDEMYLSSPLQQLRGNQQVYREFFQSNNSLVQSIALGISGDQSPHLLFRLLHGEMPNQLNPRLW